MEKKEAMKILKDFHDKSALFSVRTALDTVIPELKESNDERIRKELIKETKGCEVRLFEAVTNDEFVAWLEKQGESNMGISEATKQELDDNLNKALEKETPESCNEFLEKQGEQKPAEVEPKDYSSIDPHFGKSTDNAEPKFRNGQWIVWQDKYYKVNYNGCGYELVDQNGLSTSLEYGTIDEGAHLWTIQDANDGDVLIDEDNNIGIHKEIEGLYWDSYIYLGCDGKLRGFSIGGSHKQSNTRPATRKQRDLLFQKMKEAGYEWDADKKELKKIESFDKFEGLTDFERTLADICIGWIGEEPGWKEYIKDNADMLLKIAIKKFNSVQDTSIKQKLREE